MLVIVISFWLTMVGSASAQSGGIAEARLLSKSTSGKTVLLNVGDLEKIRVGDHGVIMRRIAEQDAPAMRLIPIARGRIVRTGPTRSLWYLYDIKDTTQLIMRDRYIVTTEGLMLQGRRRLENDRQRVVELKAKVPQTMNEKKAGEPDALAYRKDEYAKISRQHKLGEDWAKDGVLYDVDEWVSVDRAGKQQFAKALWRSPHESDFATQKRLETFEKVVSDYLLRANDPAFNYGDFYSDQTRDSSGLFRLKNNALSVTEEIRERETKQQSDNVQAFRKILERGDGWSADFSDEELGTMLNKVGVNYEQERRRSASYESFTTQAAFLGGLNALDNENRADPDNARTAKFSLEAQYEWFPLHRDPILRQFSLIGSGRYVLDGVSVGQLNAQTEEYSFGAAGAWHFLHSPFAMDRNIPFVSLGVRSGVATLRLPDAGDKANYGVFSFPQLAAGIKYNRRRGIGFKASVSVEKLLFEQSSSNRPGGNLPSRLELLEGRLNLGVTKFF